jgi:hypothetical protein
MISRQFHVVCVRYVCIHGMFSTGYNVKATGQIVENILMLLVRRGSSFIRAWPELFLDLNMSNADHVRIAHVRT